MAQLRLGVGVAVLLALAGPAAAQPAYPDASGPTGLGPLPGTLPVAVMPEGPPAAHPPHTGDEHAPLRDLTPHGFADLIPPPAHGGHGGHGCGEHHEASGFMTPFVPEHGGWYTGGEFLLMRPRNTDLDYVIASRSPGLATVGPIESIKYGLGTGLRVELGYRFGEAKWETAFAYTYFNGGGDALQDAGSGVLYPTITRPGLTDRALLASANVDLDYQLFDMLAARRVLVDDHFAVRMIGGFRFADARQILNAFYDGADARGAVVKSRSRFQGFGPIVGGEAVLVGWSGFHLYSRATAGLITGRSTNQLLESNNAGATAYINTNYDVRKVVPMGSIAIGAGWQYRTISIRAGYEITHWQGIFERPRFVDDVSQGKVVTRPADLTLEGLFIQLGLSF